MYHYHYRIIIVSLYNIASLSHLIIIIEIREETGGGRREGYVVYQPSKAANDCSTETEGAVVAAGTARERLSASTTARRAPAY